MSGEHIVPSGSENEEAADMRIWRVAMTFMLFGMLGAVAPVGMALAQDGAESPLADLGYPELNVVVSGGAPELPAELEAGRYRVTATNETEAVGSLTFVALPEGMTIEDAMADESTFYTATIPGGLSLEPGAMTEVVIDLLPGDLAVVVGFWEGDADPGAPQTITVTGDASAIDAAAVPQAAVEANMIDFAFEMPETVAAGPNVWRVTNSGVQPHEVVVMSAPDGITLEQFQALVESDAAGATPPIGAPSPDDLVPVGTAAVTSAGQTVWVAFDLEPGTYVAICYVTDQESGMPHLMLGMSAVFTVE